MLSFVVSLLAGLAGWLSNALLDTYDKILQQLPLFSLILPPIPGPSTRHIHVFAELPEPRGCRSRTTVPVHLQPSVDIVLNGIRAMQASGEQSSLKLAVKSLINLHLQQKFSYDRKKIKIPQNGYKWQHWLGRQHINLVFSPYLHSSRWAWVSDTPGTATDYTLYILYELAHLASHETLDPRLYHLPVPFFRFATVVAVFHEQMYLIMKYVFANQVAPSGEAGQAFEEAIFGGCLVGEWTSDEHVADLTHLRGLYIRQPTTGKDYALSLADVISFVEIVNAAGEETILPLLPLGKRESPAPEGNHVRTSLMEAIQKIPCTTGHERQKFAGEVERQPAPAPVPPRVRKAMFPPGLCYARPDEPIIPYTTGHERQKFAGEVD